MSLPTDVASAASVAVAVLAGAAAGWAGARVADGAVSCVEERGCVCLVFEHACTREGGGRHQRQRMPPVRVVTFRANARLASPSLPLVVASIAN